MYNKYLLKVTYKIYLLCITGHKFDLKSEPRFLQVSCNIKNKLDIKNK